MDTLAQRYALLSPSITVYGPDDQIVRPAVILFHGCGGLRPHVHLYAQAAALTGVRAYVVDSFAPRGWDRNFAVSLVCTGMVMHGYERAGDILGVLWGLKQSGRVDMNNILAVGFSHGGWALMDLMTAPLTRSGDVKIADPDPGLANAIKAMFLVYPYMNFPARTNTATWVRKPRTFGVIASRDHLTPVKHAIKTYEKLKSWGVDVETLTLDATHAFDEEDNKGGIMAYSRDAMQTSVEAMLSYMAQVFETTNLGETPVQAERAS